MAKIYYIKKHCQEAYGGTVKHYTLYIGDGDGVAGLGYRVVSYKKIARIWHDEEQAYEFAQENCLDVTGWSVEAEEHEAVTP